MYRWYVVTAREECGPLRRGETGLARRTYKIRDMVLVMARRADAVTTRVVSRAEARDRMVLARYRR